MTERSQPVKIRYIFIILLLLCIGSLIAFWQAKPPPEVIKIYKAVPYTPENTPKSTRPTVVENVHLPAAAVTETEGGVTSIDREENEMLSVDPAKLMTDSDELRERLDSTEALHTEEHGEVADTDTITEIPSSELSRMVRETFDMASVLNAYDIFVDENGKADCPKCGTKHFHLLRNSGAVFNEWCCMECEYPGGDVIDFVAWREGIDEEEATRALAESAGLLK